GSLVQSLRSRVASVKWAVRSHSRAKSNKTLRKVSSVARLAQRRAKPRYAFLSAIAHSHVRLLLARKRGRGGLRLFGRGRARMAGGGMAASACRGGSTNAPPNPRHQS